MSEVLTIRRLRLSDENALSDAYVNWGHGATGLGVEDTAEWLTSLWKPGGDFSKFLEGLDANEKGERLPPGFVPSTLLYGFKGAEENAEIIGRVHIRHTLTDALKHRGGHIGYAVVPRERRQGFAKHLLRAGLRECLKHKIDPVLITCSATNVASWRTIEACGGVLVETFFDSKTREDVRRYEVDSKSAK